MKNKNLFVFIAVMVISLSFFSCCPRNADPHSGGFIGGLQGIFCGDYDRRIEQKQSELDREKEITRTLQADFNKRENDYKTKVKELQSAQQHKDMLDKYIKSLSSDIKRLNAKSDAQKNKLVDMKDKINKLQTEINALNSKGGASPDPERYRVLEKKRDALAKEYNALLENFNSLSNIAN